MSIIHKHYFGEITSDLDHFCLVLLFMVLLQYSNTIPWRGNSHGHLQVLSFDMTMFNTFVDDQEENSESLQGEACIRHRSSKEQ